MTSTKLTLIASLCAITCGPVHAEEPSTEWRVLGPAFSYHFTKAGALKYATPPTWSCQVDTVVRDPTSPSLIRVTSSVEFKTTDPFDKSTYAPTGKLGATLGQGDAGHKPTANGSGFNYTASGTGGKQAYCGTDAKPGSDSAWHQNNPAFGLQYARRYSDHVDLVYGTYVRDSYGSASVMVAGGREWPIAKLGTVSFDGGVVGGLWWRTDATANGWALERRVAPFVLPALSINESRTGLGLNLGFAPRLMFGSHYWNSTPTVMAQLTYLVQKTESVKPGVTGVCLEALPQGGAQASVGVAF